MRLCDRASIMLNEKGFFSVWRMYMRLRTANSCWPKLSDYPATEAGWNQYANDWVARKRRAQGINDIPIAVIQEHRLAMAAGRENGWREREE